MNSDDSPSTPLPPSAFERAALVVGEAIREARRAYLSDEPHAELIFVALLARSHVLLEGLPGVAKTTLAQSVAAVCGCPMKRVQLTPDLLPADILGGAIFNPQLQRFEVHKGPIFTHILLADELNRAPAKTQSALLEAMQEAQVTLDGAPYALPQPFFTLATQNPKEQAGVYALPEAQLDRFALKLELGYPSERAELEMLTTYERARPAPRPVLTPERLLELQRLADEVYVHPEMARFVVQITRATRAHPAALTGASPRAGLSLMRLSKARALSRGRDFVSPDDPIALAPVALAHRLRLTPEAEFDALSPSALIREVLLSTPYSGPSPRRPPAPSP
jgi:MoxR-like ATPase